DDVEESEDDKKVDVGYCLEESESESKPESKSKTASEAATLDHISEDDDELIEVRKRNIEIKYKKKKSGTEEVDQVPNEPHKEASEAAIEQASDVANELPNEMDTGGAGEDTGGAGDDESDYAAFDDYLSPESSYLFVRLFLSQIVCQVRKRGKEVAVEKHGTKSGTTKKGKEKGKETVKSGTTEVNNEANQEANQVATTTTVRRENKAPSSNVGEGTPTVSKRADSGNSYLKMSATGAPILINEAKNFEANNKRKGRPPLPRRSSKAPVIGLQSNQVSSEAQVPSSQGSISASKQVSTTASKQSLTTASAQASATASKQSLTTDVVASSSKPKTRSATVLETQHQETHHQASSGIKKLTITNN
ncbi:hypothetical protein IFM89_026659, partial [Coptis chinensis]